ncbi:MAG: sensor histidine kinase [Mycobacteriales bacterium]
MGSPGPATPMTPGEGPRPGGRLAPGVAAAAAVARAAGREPFTGRARRELGFCLVSVPLSLSLSGIGLCLLAPAVAVALVEPELSSTWVAALATVAWGILLILLLTRIARRLGVVHRRLARRLLDERIEAPPPLRPAKGIVGRLGTGLRDGTGWRAVAYLLVKLPVAVLECYAVFLWAAGLVNLTYPFWWGLFRNHPPAVQLSPALVSTPFPGRVLHVGTFPGTFLAFALGSAMVLAAPWVTRAVVAADRRLMRGLLGPSRLTRRVRDLEQTRALAVDDSAALLRRLERDLHDGAQVRLATLAMNLGRAREKLDGHGETLDLAAARALVDAAHQAAKDALIELRDLARGIHPPVLDNGLADALATLAGGTPVPVELGIDVPLRPTPAIETITYFCAAELLANAAKHSHANKIEIQVVGRDAVLLLSVADDGVGGADPARGTGLSGLRQRVSTVDGRLDITSPAGGPTVMTATLPLHA